MKNNNFNDFEQNKFESDRGPNDDEEDDGDDESEFSSSFSLEKLTSASSTSSDDEIKVKPDASKIIDKKMRKQKNIDDSDSVIFEHDQDDANKNDESHLDNFNQEDLKNQLNAKRIKPIALQKTSTIDENKIKPTPEFKKSPLKKYRQFIYIQVQANFRSFPFAKNKKVSILILRPNSLSVRLIYWGCIFD